MNIQSVLTCLFLLFFSVVVSANDISKEGFFVVENTYSSNIKADYIQIRDLQEPTNKFAFPYTEQSRWTFSGLPNGEYSIEITSREGAVAIDSIKVEHWSLSTAFPLFFGGMIMFIALIVILYRYQILEQKSAKY